MAIDHFLTLCCAGSAAITAAICLKADPLARISGLTSRPDGSQRLHRRETPLMGGVSVLVPVFLIALIYSCESTLGPTTLAAIAAGFVMFLIGLLDDRFGISAVGRLAGIAAVAIALLAACPSLVLSSLNLWILGHQVPLPLHGIEAIIITAFIVVGFVNAGNMADGINGQCLGSVMIWCLLMLPYLTLQERPLFILLGCSTFVAFGFNLRGRLFSGSAGAYALSLLIALGSIEAYYGRGYGHAELQVLWFWLPTLDCLRLLVSRALENGKPFEGDRGHIHHLLQDLFPTGTALVIYFGFMAGPGILARWDERWGEWALMMGVAAYIGFVLWRVHVRNRKNAVSPRTKEFPPGESAERHQPVTLMTFRPFT